jgi:hypothetical protein
MQVVGEHLLLANIGPSRCVSCRPNGQHDLDVVKDARAKQIGDLSERSQRMTGTIPTNNYSHPNLIEMTLERITRLRL